MSGAAAPPPLTIIFPIPNGTDNPFTYSATRLINQMYPPLLPGFTGRVAGLLTLLVLVIIFSVVYLSLTMIDLKGRQREVWIFRLVQRPAGKYLVTNQYLLYPICSIVMSLLWILLVVHNFQVYGNNHGDPANTLRFTPLLWIPLYTHLSITTFAVLGGANLASTGGYKNRDSGSHFLSPLAANAAYIVGFPVIIITCAAVGIWTGHDWRLFALKWKECLDVLNTAADNFDGSTIDPAIVATATALALARRVLYQDFVMTQKVSAVIYITSAACLILVNVIGGLRLLLTLRSLNGSGGPGSQFVHRNTPIVARMTPVAPDVQPLPPTTTSITSLQSHRPSLGTRSSSTSGALNPSLKRLEWDITLFFFSVVPACIAFIAYSAWLSTHYTDVLTHAVLLEFSLFGMQWIYSALVLISTIAMSIKVALTIRETNRPYKPSLHRGSISTTSSSSGGGASMHYNYTRRVSVATSFATITAATDETEKEMEEKEKLEPGSILGYRFGKRTFGSSGGAGLGLTLEECKEVEIDVEAGNQVL